MPRRPPNPPGDPRNWGADDALFERAIDQAPSANMENEDDVFERAMGDDAQAPQQPETDGDPPPASTEREERAAEDAGIQVFHAPAGTDPLAAEDALFSSAMAEPLELPEPQADTSAPMGINTQGLIRRLQQGQIAHDVQVDLHGLQQEDARRHLREALTTAVAAGQRYALVITGRGLHSEGRPVLRDETPQWLRLDCSELVEDFGGAPKRLGGEGALLVVLRRRAAHSTSGEV